jgi:hypothetical protein
MVSGAILGQHLHNMVKQLSTVMAFGFRWMISPLRKLRIAIKNLLEGRPSPAMRWDSK